MRSGPALSGSVQISGATKNSGLKLMAASLLAPGVTVLRNMAPVGDLDVMIELLRAIGADVAGTGPEEVTVDSSGPLRPVAPYELVSRMRASINVLGPLLARCGEVRVARPGGDNIGSRKLDMHVRGLEAMGAEVTIAHGFVEARCNVLGGARVVLEFPSVGATENLLTAAVLAKGETVIENAAREPELADLASFLNRMGARVEGAGTSTVHVEGVEQLTPVEHDIVGDRVEAGTLLIACGAVGGEIVLEGARVDHLDMVASKLVDMGMSISATPTGIQAEASTRLRAVDVATLPFPGFATDFMPLAVALLATSEGTGIVTENIFESRFGFVDELNRMGAEVLTEGRHAVVRGVPRLSGAPVRALDVRAGAALLVAGLSAEGETTVLDPEHLERGYSGLPEKLSALGADVERVG